MDQEKLFEPEWTEPQKERAARLVEFWDRVTNKEIELLLPKAIEYGSADLKVMGRALLTLFPNDDKRWTREQLESIGQEMAIAFYVLGKVARLFGAYEQGILPNDDAWFDLGVYARMAQRVRETGEWG